MQLLQMLLCRAQINFEDWCWSCWQAKEILSKVIWHLHGQAGWFTVWANRNQKSGPLNFVPKSHLSFVQIVPFVKKWAWRPETGIKECFEEMEHEFPHGHSQQDYLFRCYVAPRNFPLERPKMVMFHFTSQLAFLENFWKW